MVVFPQARDLSTVRPQIDLRNPQTCQQENLSVGPGKTLDMHTYTTPYYVLIVFK